MLNFLSRKLNTKMQQRCWKKANFRIKTMRNSLKPWTLPGVRRVTITLGWKKTKNCLGREKWWLKQEPSWDWWATLMTKKDKKKSWGREELLHWSKATIIEWPRVTNANRSHRKFRKMLQRSWVTLQEYSRKKTLKIILRVLHATFMQFGSAFRSWSLMTIKRKSTQKNPRSRNSPRSIRNFICRIKTGVPSLKSANP